MLLVTILCAVAPGNFVLQSSSNNAKEDRPRRRSAPDLRPKEALESRFCILC